MKSINFRGLFFFIKLSILIAVVVVLMRYPGVIQISWLGYRLETTPVVFLIGLSLAIAFLAFLLSVWRYIWRLPVFWTQCFQANRLKKSKSIFMDGLTALFADELDQAESLAKKAVSLNPKSSLNHILLAKTAYSTKKYETAENEFMALSQNPTTAFIGFKGLYRIAVKRHDLNQMRHILRQALSVQPNSPWALTHLFQLDLKAGSFDMAERIMEQLVLNQEIPPKQSAHSLGVVYWLRAKQFRESGDQNGFLKYAVKAFKVAPELTELAVNLAETYHKMGHLSKAVSVVKDAFNASPHPDLASVWENLHSGKTSLEIYKEMEKLTSSVPHHPESLACLAQGAIQAKLWGQARQHLNELLKTGAVSRTYALLAVLAEAENPGNMRLVQDWLRKAVTASSDLSWGCSVCITPSKAWAPFCSKCDAFDSIVWRSGTFSSSAEG